MLRSVLILTVVWTAYFIYNQETVMAGNVDQNINETFGRKDLPYCTRYRHCRNGSTCCIKVRSFWNFCCPNELRCCYWKEPKCCKPEKNELGGTFLRILSAEEVDEYID